jgi:hypothetical protein
MAPAQVQRPPSPRLPPEIMPDEARFRNAVKLDPANYSVEFENSELRALRLKLKGDESAAMHDDRSGLLICLTECHLHP